MTILMRRYLKMTLLQKKKPEKGSSENEHSKKDNAEKEYLKVRIAKQIIWKTKNNYEKEANSQHGQQIGLGSSEQVRH